MKFKDLSSSRIYEFDTKNELMVSIYNLFTCIKYYQFFRHLLNALVKFYSTNSTLKNVTYTIVNGVTNLEKSQLLFSMNRTKIYLTKKF